MRLRLLVVRAAAGALAVGSAAPVNLPYDAQAMQIAATGDADIPVRAARATRETEQRSDDTGAGELHKDARLLKIGANDDPPCDSGDWATSNLFGPHAGVMAALGITPTGIENGTRDTALADALGDRPSVGGADSSAFGSVFGNAGQPELPGSGGLFGSGGGATGTDSSAGGGVITGGGTGTGGGAGTGSGGKGTGAGTGGGGTDSSGDTGSAGGAGSTGGAGTGSGTGGGSGSAGTGFPPPVSPILPTDPQTGDTSTGGAGDGHTGTQPDAPGAVPEPASWATMLVGFGLIGGMLRRRTRIRFA